MNPSMNGDGEERLRQTLRRLRRKAPPPQGLPGDLCNRLETGLILCMPREYATLFVDQRIALWRDCLPDNSHTPIDQIRALIDTLYTRQNAQGENALHLFLTVLSERTSPADACYKHLCLLAADLRQQGRPK